MRDVYYRNNQILDWLMKKCWRLWAKALGEKTGVTNKEADHVALVRTIVVLTYIITNCFIVAGVIRHW